MKKLILILIIGSLFMGCAGVKIPFVSQDISLAGKIRAGMTTDEVIKIMGEPIISELENNVEEWHYWRTGELLKMTKDTFVALYFLENKLIAKQYYSISIGGGGAGFGSCEKFIKKGDYKVPPEVQVILDKNN